MNTKAIEKLIREGEEILEAEHAEVVRKAIEDAMFEEQLRERFVACVEELFPALRGFVSWECWHTPIMRDYGSLSWDSQALIRVEGLAPVRLLMRSVNPNGDEVRAWDPWRGKHSNRGPFEVLRFRLDNDDGRWYAREEDAVRGVEELAVALAWAKEVGDTWGEVMREIEGKEINLTPNPFPSGKGSQEGEITPGEVFTEMVDPGLPLETRLLECLVELVDVVVSERISRLSAVETTD